VRHAITVIICKSDKYLHTNPGSYCLNTLLSFLGKIFESHLTKRITCWAKNNSVIAQGHFNGVRANQVTENTNLFVEILNSARKRLRAKKEGIFFGRGSRKMSV
jgi:uncharacterized membrane protein